MKKFITIIVLALLVTSCGKSKEEQMMYDYQKESYLKYMDTNIDNADFKIVSIEKVKDITTNDSLDILTPYFETKTKEKIKYFEESISMSKELIQSKKRGMKTTILAYGKEGKQMVLNQIKREEESIKGFEKSIDNYSNECKGTFLESTYNFIKIYKQKKDSILSTQYKGTYDISTPMGIKTFTKYYYTNQTKDKFVLTEKAN